MDNSTWVYYGTYEQFQVMVKLIEKLESENLQLYGKYGLYDLQQRRMKGQQIRTELELKIKDLEAEVRRKDLAHYRGEYPGTQPLS